MELLLGLADNPPPSVEGAVLCAMCCVLCELQERHMRQCRHTHCLLVSARHTSLPCEQASVRVGGLYTPGCAQLCACSHVYVHACWHTLLCACSHTLHRRLATPTGVWMGWSKRGLCQCTNYYARQHREPDLARQNPYVALNSRDAGHNMAAKMPPAATLCLPCSVAIGAGLCGLDSSACSSVAIGAGLCGLDSSALLLCGYWCRALRS